MTSRYFRKVGGFHDGETAAIEIKTDDSGYRSVHIDGALGQWGEKDPPFFTIALAEARIASGVWEEIAL